MFTPEDAPTVGRAHVLLQGHKRFSIEISEGANSLLSCKIEEREKTQGTDSFVKFLASARWIHLTSLCNKDDFRFLLRRMEAAKEINPCLLVSIDPGYEYTLNANRQLLSETLALADYVFLNDAEYARLAGGADASSQRKTDALAQQFKKNPKVSPQVWVWKKPSQVKLVSFWKGTKQERTFHHRRLRFLSKKNDTGAGDAFAGGFIAGMLSPCLISHQPGPIRLGRLTKDSLTYRIFGKRSTLSANTVRKTSFLVNTRTSSSSASSFFSTS